MAELPPLLDEFLREVNSALQAEQDKRGDWENFMVEKCLFAVDDAIQNHLKGCARCRFQGAIPKRKPNAAPAEISPPTTKDLLSLCPQALTELSTTDGCAKIVRDALQELCQQLTKECSGSRANGTEKAFVEALSETVHDISFENLKLVQREALKWGRIFTTKQPIVDIVQQQEQILRECSHYYTHRVVPMFATASRANIVSGAGLFVIEPESFEDAVNKRVSKLNSQVRKMATKWETDCTALSGTPMTFQIDGVAWLEKEDMKLQDLLLGDDAPVETTPNKAAVSRRSSSNTQRSTTPSTAAPSARLTTPTHTRTPSRSSTPAKPASATPAKSTPSKLSRPEPPPTDDAGLSLAHPPLHIRPTPDPSRFGNASSPPHSDPDDPSSLKVSVDRSNVTGGGEIRVCVRVRPMVQRERNAGHKPIVKCWEDTNTIHIVHRTGGKDKKQELAFETVCDGHVSQQEFFERISCEQLLDRCLEGNHVTLFAYGQTGSGKTFTIGGPQDVLGLPPNASFKSTPTNSQDSSAAPNEGTDPAVPAIGSGKFCDVFATDTVVNVLEELLKDHINAQGVLPRISNQMFQKIAKRENEDSNTRYFVTASYMEIYNEQIQDLLTTTIAPLKVREAMDGGSFFVEGLIERECSTLSEMLDVVVSGTRNRRVTAHEMNSESSRSHAVFVAKVERRVIDPETNTMWIKRGKLSVIDLAGSESVKLTKTTGTSLRETAGINKSLLSLSNIISKLAEGASATASTAESDPTSTTHIPWRNSKLTMLLMDSLCGSGTTLMVAACSPSEEYYAETTSTLQFATKAGNITRSNLVTLTPHELEVLRLKQQIDDLKKNLDTSTEQLTEANRLLAAREKIIFALRDRLSANNIPPPEFDGDGNVRN